MAFVRIESGRWKAVVVATLVLANVAGPISLATSVVDISTFSWLTGVWQADAPTASFQNTFQPAANGEMLCTVQVAKQGQIVHYELCAIRKKESAFVFQVVGFNADFTPAPPVPLRPLLSASADSANFNGISFVRTGPDSMTATVNMVGPDGSAKPMELHYLRKSSFASANPAM